MADFVLVAILVAFIGLCIAYVAWCDRIIGADDPAGQTAGQTAAAPHDTAGAPEAVSA
jgi:hypothetical protein